MGRHLKALEEKWSTQKFEEEKEQAKLFDKFEKIAEEFFPEIFNHCDVKFSEHTAYADYMLELKEGSYVQTLQEAIGLAKEINSMPIFYHCDGFRSFRPERCIKWDKLTYNEQEGCYTNKTGCHKVFEIEPYYLKVDGLNDDEYTLHLFSKVQGVLFEIRLPILSCPEIRRDTQYQYHQQAMAIVRKSCNIINNSEYFEEHAKFWASESYPNSFILYSRKYH